MASSCSESPITATDIGAIMFPSRKQIIKMHTEYKGITPNPSDDIYAQLPSSLVKNREWNLPQVYGYMVYTALHPSSTGATYKRLIKGTTATWKQKESHSVSDDFGNRIGIQTDYFLTYKIRGKAVGGSWKAEEYISYENNKENSAIVILKCQDMKLVEKEIKVKETEDELMDLQQVVMVTADDRRKFKNVVLKLARQKKDLKAAKEEARITEQRDATNG